MTLVGHTLYNNELRVVYENQDKELCYANEGDAGIDLRSSIDVVLKPGSRYTVPCGIKMAIPSGTVGMVCPRSGLAAKNGITVVNAPGIIDSGYRGEVMVILLNTDQNGDFVIKKGDRIAQLVIVPFLSCEVVRVDDLDESMRGESGFGSSGVE